MEKLTAKEAREQFGCVLSKAAHGSQRIVVTKNGKDAAAIVPMSDLELLSEIERLCDLLEAEAAVDESRVKGTVLLEKLKKDLGL